MTEADAPVVRRQIVVDAPIERAFTVFTERFGDFKPPEHNLLQAPIAETVFEPKVGGHIYDRGVDGTECRWARSWRTSHRTGSCSAGTSARTGRSRPTPTTPARSRSASSPRPRPHADRTGTPPPRPARPRLAVVARRRRRRPGLAAVPRPLRRPVRRGPLTCRRSPPAPKSTGQQMRCSPTPPTRPGSTSGSKASSTATWTTRRPDRRRAVPHDPTHRRRQPDQHLEAHPHRRTEDWGVRGIDGPIRATVDLTVEPLTATPSRLTIAVDFEGHGIGKTPGPARGPPRSSARKCPPTWQPSNSDSNSNRRRPADLPAQMSCRADRRAASGTTGISSVKLT